MTPVSEVSQRANSGGDARWQRWIEKGHAHDARVRHRLRVVALALASLVALGSAILLTIAG